MSGNLLSRRVVLYVALIAFGMVLLLALVGLWAATYPDTEDPKNIYYVLWKHGLNDNMNLDNALGAMTHDTWAVNRVKGLSKAQLVSRFGYVLTPEQQTPYLQSCYTIGGAAGELGVRADGKEAVFLRNSPWMAILDDGKAVDLVLCKGY
jgi:hypothetical protein